MTQEERLNELLKRYVKLPNEIKNMKRWVCYNKSNKAPMNALNGKFAQSNNSLTWTSFANAIRGCVKYNFDGIGFMLGEGIVGIDLDNHEDPHTGKIPMTDEEFHELTTEFVSSMNSYSEFSQSGKGVHIICKGSLPQGNRKSVSVEMYDTGRYFAMTGNVMNDMPIEERQKPLEEMWKKYLGVNTYEPREKDYTHSLNENGMHFGKDSFFTTDINLSLSDNEIIEKIKASKNGQEFIRLYNGDMSAYQEDHSAADMAFCSILAFWCNRNVEQMDRIFRNSALMREKWDKKRGEKTYGEITLEKAIFNTSETYVPSKKEKIFLPNANTSIQATNIVTLNNQTVMNIDENGDPIIHEKQIFKKYSYDDTGNAERFYDYFGDLFKYNVTNKYFMFWDGKTWIVDESGIIKKYADVMVKILKKEAQDMNEDIENASKEGNEEEINRLKEIQKAAIKNATRVANKAGKEAMISEFQHLHNIPTNNSAFDSDPLLLNTDSGIIKLDTGEVMPFDASKMLSKNTKCSVSYETPTTWIKFLNDIFQRPEQSETDEIIECMQQSCGYSLSGLVTEQCMFLLHGSGSNGKSTFMEQIAKVMGDYATTTPSSTLVQSKLDSSANLFSIAKLNGSRYVSTSETDEGSKLAESTVKVLTGGDKISAAFKFGNEFDFYPQFKIWMSTNNKPIIRGTDLGIWRRMFFFPFERTFTEEQKDKKMPEKLAKETPQILGWCIKGFMKFYKSQKGLIKPKCVEAALAEYKSEMDVITKFLNRQCADFPNYKTKARDLYKNYKEWAKDDTEYCMSESKFGAEIVKRGYKKKRFSDGYYYYGIKLNDDKKGHSFANNDENDEY